MDILRETIAFSFAVDLIMQKYQNVMNKIHASKKTKTLSWLKHCQFFQTISL